MSFQSFKCFCSPPGATDACRTTWGKDEETAPTSASSAKGFCPLKVFGFLKWFVCWKFSSPESFGPKIMRHFQEITVVAGDGKSVKIHLGGEKELEDCRRQVTFSLATCYLPLSLLHHFCKVPVSCLPSSNNCYLFAVWSFYGHYFFNNWRPTYAGCRGSRSQACCSSRVWKCWWQVLNTNGR